MKRKKKTAKVFIITLACILHVNFRLIPEKEKQQNHLPIVNQITLQLWYLSMNEVIWDPALVEQLDYDYQKPLQDQRMKK